MLLFHPFLFKNTLLLILKHRKTICFTWTSEFSYLGGKVNPTRSNLVIVTENARNAPFNEEELQPLNIKLKDLLS